MATRRWWLGSLVVHGAITLGCATGQDADPDAATGLEDVKPKPSEDTGEKVPDAGEGDDAVVEGDVQEVDVGEAVDTGAMDAGTIDSGAADTGAVDAGPTDVGMMDQGVLDSGPLDTGVLDTGPRDTGVIDTGPRDTGVVDTGPVDTGPVDTGVVDAGPTLVCTALAGNRTCHGSSDFAPCCIPILIATSCGCQIPLFGCLPCP